uniref:Uncharacterized protein n=1 Tax=Branchiostoma floridae TaxID=7739 RepID=C3Z7Z0_BRAFL|eukprot:XP_002595292.1 hypothetical protein BRAFLDRAFT_128104 [Branchiostoma floridae]
MDMDRSPGLGAGGVPGGGSASSPAFPGSLLLGQASPLAVTTAAGVSPVSPSKSPSCRQLHRKHREVGHVTAWYNVAFAGPGRVPSWIGGLVQFKSPGNDNSAAFPLSGRPPRLNCAGRVGVPDRRWAQV